MLEANQRPSGPWLKRFTFLTAAVTFALIWMGGLVTSHNAGLAVPDWPNTYGYNMFFFPISRWVGNIYYEHTHRLMAVLVSSLTMTLLVWTFIRPIPNGCARWVWWRFWAFWPKPFWVGCASSS